MLVAPASHASLRLVTPPGVELFDASDDIVAEYLHLDDFADEAALQLLLAVAREQFELRTGLAFITQTWEASWDKIPCSQRDGRRYRGLSLGRGPLVELTTTSYVNSEGATVNVPVAGFVVGAGAGVRQEFGRACLVPATDWPDLGDYPQAFRIQFTAGFGEAAADVPEGIRLAVLILASHWYQNRLPLAIGNIVNPLPDHMQSLIDAWRIPYLS